MHYLAKTYLSRTNYLPQSYPIRYSFAPAPALWTEAGA